MRVNKKYLWVAKTKPMVQNRSQFERKGCAITRTWRRGWLSLIQSIKYKSTTKKQHLENAVLTNAKKREEQTDGMTQTG